jgi:hypothetical protein
MKALFSQSSCLHLLGPSSAVREWNGRINWWLWFNVIHFFCRNQRTKVAPGTLRYIVYIVSPSIVDLGTRLVTLEAFKVLCLGVPYQKIKKSCGIRWFQDVSRCFKMPTIFNSVKCLHPSSNHNLITSLLRDQAMEPKTSHDMSGMIELISCNIM